MAHLRNSSAELPSANVEADYVKIVGEQIGIVGMPEECCSLLADHISYRVKILMEQMKKLAVHSRRTRVTADDAEFAISTYGRMLIFGHGSVKKPATFKAVPTSVETLGQELFVVDDSELELSSVVSSSGYKPPVNIALRAHWLVVDGIQPGIPENQVYARRAEKDELSSEESGETIADDVGSELKPSLNGINGVSAPFRFGLKPIRKAERVHVKPTVNHELSVEQQRFFQEVMEACVGVDDKRRIEALQSLQIDTGINALLPNISRFLAQGVRCNVVQRSLAILIYIVRAYASLVHNRSVKLDSVLHEVIPSLLSCMVSRYLCVRPDVDNHWTLRDYASKCLVQVIREQGVCDVRLRTQQTLQRVFLDPNSAVSMQYGAFHALFDLSSPTERALFYPRFVHLLQQTHPNNTLQQPPLQRMESERLYNLLSKYEVAMDKCATQHQLNKNTVKTEEKLSVMNN